MLLNVLERERGGCKAMVKMVRDSHDTPYQKREHRKHGKLLFESLLGAGVVEIGKAISPTFSQSASGPFVSQVVFVYATVPEAKQVWQRASGNAALDCLARTVTSGSTKATRFTVLHTQRLVSPQAGTHSAAYRVIASAHSTSPAQTIDVYFDLVLVGEGKALTLISWAGFEQPLDRSLEVAVARAVARRL